MDIIDIRVNNCPPLPLCTPYHENISCVIFHLFTQIIVEIRFDLRCPSDALICQPGIYHIHCKNRWFEPLRPIFSTQLVFYVKTFLAAPIVTINLATCDVVYLCCDWMCDGQINHIDLFIWGRFVFPPSHVSLWLPFLHRVPSKNELPPVPLHPKKAPNTSFALSTSLVNNPIIPP